MIPLNQKENGIQLSLVKKGKPRSGYVHKSRVQFIESFKKFNRIKRNDSAFEFSLDSMIICLKTGKFQRNKHTVKSKEPAM